MAYTLITQRGLKDAIEPGVRPVMPLGQSLVGSEAANVVIEGEPVTKARPRFAKGRVYTPSASKNWETVIRWTLTGAGLHTPDGDHWMSVDMKFHCKGNQRKDVDNLVKLVLDACNGFVWLDDMQVETLSAKRILSSGPPYTELTVQRTGRYTVDCPVCGRVARTSGRVWGRGTAIYCSRECYDSHQRAGSVYPCSFCGAQVYRQRSRGGQDHYFCSKACKVGFTTGSHYKPRTKKAGS